MFILIKLPVYRNLIKKIKITQISCSFLHTSFQHVLKRVFFFPLHIICHFKKGLSKNKGCVIKKIIYFREYYEDQSLIFRIEKKKVMKNKFSKKFIN